MKGDIIYDGFIFYLKKSAILAGVCRLFILIFYFFFLNVDFLY